MVYSLTLFLVSHSRFLSGCPPSDILFLLEPLHVFLYLSMLHWKSLHSQSQAQIKEKDYVRQSTDNQRKTLLNLHRHGSTMWMDTIQRYQKKEKQKKRKAECTSNLFHRPSLTTLSLIPRGQKVEGQSTAQGSHLLRYEEGRYT